MTGQVSLGSGDAGAANGLVEMRGLARQGEKAAMVERASLAIKGTRIAHEIRLETDLADKVTVRALLDGGLVPGAKAPAWRGRLESLETAGRAAFALAAPATLVVSEARIELGEALFAGDPGQVRLAVTRWTPAGLELRGTSKAVVVRSIQQALRLEGPVGSNLVLAGDWDVRVGETVEGFVSFRRESGDVRVGQPRQALGLETLTLRAEARGSRVKAAVDVRGRQVGEWKGEAAATLARGADGWSVSPVAAIDGRFTVDVPELSWTAAWIGPDALVRGRFKGEGVLEGTARDPAWNGRVEVTGLAIREPALGAEVAEGTIAIALKNREARIERFELAMPWQPSEEAGARHRRGQAPGDGHGHGRGCGRSGHAKGRGAPHGHGISAHAPCQSLHRGIRARAGGARRKQHGDDGQFHGGCRLVRDSGLRASHVVRRRDRRSRRRGSRRRWGARTHSPRSARESGRAPAL